MAFVPCAPVYGQPIVNGATSKSVFIYIQAASGLPATGLAYNTASLLVSYAGTKLASVAITLADLAAITTAWSSGGFKEVDATNMPGWYRLDVPNAALALSADEVVITVIKDAVAAGVLVIPIPTKTVGTVEAKVDIIDTTADTVAATLVTADLGNPITGTLAQNVEAIGLALPGFDVTNPSTTRTDA